MYLGPWVKNYYQHKMHGNFFENLTYLIKLNCKKLNNYNKNI